VQETTERAEREMFLPCVPFAEEDNAGKTTDERNDANNAASARRQAWILPWRNLRPAHRPIGLCPQGGGGEQASKPAPSLQAARDKIPLR
jgi:hypothetical protein